MQGNGRSIVWLALGLLGLAGCRSGGPREPGPPDDARVVAAWLAGSFDSSEQHQRDPQNFFDIRLHHTPIWTSRRDGPWLYMEQATTMDLARPYRQRVYQIVQGDRGRAESVVYELPGNPLDFAGAYKDPARLDALSPAQLRKREGCTVYLKRSGESYVGGTRGLGCATSLRGASRVTSEVTLTATEIHTLDRGLDEAGQQVWGPEAGPYRFRRVTGLAPR